MKHIYGSMVLVVALMLVVKGAFAQTVAPPTVMNDSYYTPTSTTLVVSAPGVLSNDHSNTNKTMTATQEASPAHGTLYLSANGAFTYVPNAGFVGTDVFTYRVNDGLASIPAGVVSIVVGTGSKRGTITSISCGKVHAVALGSDGLVWAWGSDADGELGNGTSGSVSSNDYPDSAIPVQVKVTSRITVISTRSRHSLALHQDGSVWAWGVNYNGELGDGTDFNRPRPVKVPNFGDVISVSAGEYFSIALKKDGSVWSWGRGIYGTLGNGAALNSKVPVKVKNLSGVVAICAGIDHAMALRSDGTVWTWGRNDCGQLGNNSTVDSSIPVQVKYLSGVKSLSAGAGFAMALTNTGNVYGWGRGYGGLMGVGVTTNRLTPVLISGLPKMKKIACGTLHILALTETSDVWAWGSNNYGELGRAYPTYGANNYSVYFSDIPRKVAGVSGVADISAGNSFSMALADNGVLWSWGDNSRGQLGYGLSRGISETPKQTLFTDVKSIAAAHSHTLVLKNDGTAWDSGDNACWQLGNGTMHVDSSYPTRAHNLTGVTQIADNGEFSLALKNDGTLWGWGHNGLGQFGNGTTETSSIPVRGAAMAGILKISNGSSVSYIIKSDGNLWTCGYNGEGQLGIGTMGDPSKVPVQVPGMTNVVAATGGYGHSVALKADGTAWGWGSNVFGGLGNGTSYNNIASPQQIAGLSGITAVCAGWTITAALKDDGTVWTCGGNSEGSLGRTGDTTVMAQVPNLSGVTAISAGGLHMLALKNDGTVWAWGDNRCGQLGDGTHVRRYSPVQVLGLTNVTAIDAGWNHSVALKDDGTVWAWGSGWEGELCDGRLMASSAPIPADGIPMGVDSTPPTTPAIDDGGRIAFNVNSVSATWFSSDPESGISKYEYAIGTTPFAPASGYFQGWTSADTATSATMQYRPFVLGRTYYWYVRATNGNGLWSDVGVSDGIRMVTAKDQSDGANISVSGMVMTGSVAPGVFYIEDTRRSWGIRVTKSNFTPPAGKVNVSGVIRTNANGERYIAATSVSSAGAGSVSPLFVTNRGVGGCDREYNRSSGAGQRGVENGAGPNNLGVLLRTTGSVTFVGTDHFYIDDGSHIKDESGAIGIRVVCESTPRPQIGDRVAVTGISSLTKSGDKYYRCFLTRSAADISVL